MFKRKEGIRERKGKGKERGRREREGGREEREGGEREGEGEGGERGIRKKLKNSEYLYLICFSQILDLRLASA